MTRCIRQALILIALLPGTIAFSQNNIPVEKTIANFQKQLAQAPFEKAYLQLDKPIYAAGDTIWFKGYVVTGSNHQLSEISSVLNVELINEKDSIKQNLKFFIKSGLCEGDIALPDSIKAGNYRVRAYTNWMRNAGDDYFFDENISVVNAITNTVLAKANYSYDTQNGLQKINPIINYTDLNGNPYANTKVSYSVQAGSKTIDNGKGVTDNKGNLSMSFVNSSPAAPVKIISNVSLPDKSTSTNTVLIKPKDAPVNIQFFPEGGNMINGVEGRVAFKAVNINGLGVPVSGTVVDGQNNPVANFSCGPLGMGVFTFMPENNKIYKAKITNAGATETVVELPKATSNGFALNVSEAGTEYVRAIAVSDIKAKPTDVITLVAQAGGVVYYVGKGKPGSNSFIATIPKSKFPTGIAQFTLFSSDGEPINERLLFVQNNDQLKLGITAEKQTYTPQQKVKLQLTAKTNDSKPAQGSFSVAVVDESKVPADEANENNILSNLLLTADLKGYIEKPGYYFANSNETTRADLDALMLTQGYRRFEWKKVINNESTPILFQPDTGLSIHGRLTQTNDKPVANEKITLYTTDGGFFSQDTLTDNAGHFSFKNMAFPDNTKFIAQAAEKDRFKLKISIDFDKTKVTPNKNAAELVGNNYAALLPYMQNSKKTYTEEVADNFNNKAKLLKEVLIKDKSKQPVVLKFSDNLNGAGRADQIFTAAQIKDFRCGFLNTCLEGRILGVTFERGLPFVSRNIAMFGKNAKPMLIIVDGIAIDSNQFLMLNASDIESIEVLRSLGYALAYGNKGGNGVLVITMKRGISDDDMTYNENLPGYIKFNAKGFYKVREFYSPQYDNPKTNTKVADLRTTIYWNPGLATDKNGNTSFEYFNTGNKGTYRVTVEGIDAYGNLAHQVYRYKVE